MALHTKDQSREGKQPAQKPVQTLVPPHCPSSCAHSREGPSGGAREADASGQPSPAALPMTRSRSSRAHPELSLSLSLALSLSPSPPPPPLSHSLSLSERSVPRLAPPQVNAWEPGQADYLQFLVDSRHVYATLEELVTKYDALAQYRNSGLERAGPLEKDIAWFKEQGFAEPPVGAQGTAYAALLRELACAGNVPYHWQVFTCHFYNFYFAHTAGGRMIGKMMSDKLLDGHKLEFYQWSAGDVDKELLPGLRNKIDEQAATWTPEQKAACLKETANTFRYGGSLLQHISRRG